MEKEKKQGCCNDEQATIRLKKDQLASTINDVPGNQIIYIQHQYPSLIQPVLTSDNDVLQSIHGPPLIQAISPVILSLATMEKVWANGALALYTCATVRKGNASRNKIIFFFIL